MSVNLENSAVATGLRKVSFRDNPKGQSQNSSHYHTVMLISHTNKLCSKSFNKLDLEKAEEPEIKLSTFIGSWRKDGNSRKTSISASLTMLEPLTV